MTITPARSRTARRSRRRADDAPRHALPPNDEWPPPRETNDEWPPRRNTKEEWPPPRETDEEWPAPSTTNEEWPAPSRTSDEWPPPRKTNDEWLPTRDTNEEWPPPRRTGEGSPSREAARRSGENGATHRGETDGATETPRHEERHAATHTIGERPRRIRRMAPAESEPQQAPEELPGAVAEQPEASGATELRFRYAARSHRAKPSRAYLWAALVRCALYLGPLSVAAAAAQPLTRVAWPVPLVTLLLGWSAAQFLTCTGVSVAHRAGAAAAARHVGCGFAAVAGLWCALVWVAPSALLGPDRGLALVVGLGGIGTLATVTAALVTRAEPRLVLWSLPCWLLGAAALVADTYPVPIGTLLPAAIVVPLVRAFRPVVVPGVRGRPPRLTSAEVRRGSAYLVIGASQAVCVGLVWQAGPSGSTAPFWLPLLLAVPILEALIGWHTGQVEAGLDAAENSDDYRRHVRSVTLITLTGLVPPFAVGVTLALTAYRLPAGLPALAHTQAGVLGLAGGTLLGGVFAITYLLAARARTGIAATLAAAPPLVTAALPILPLPSSGPLPDAVAVLAATHLAGLIVVALTAQPATTDDSRRTP
ncbi:hypothetical protein [Actinoplanes sp. URMC 104]|uniref:hypothetical protein n=1 Tax=Actinoplanes sp. URMC 104 TaxID=3423409 RepID=UPI003F1CC94D